MLILKAIAYIICYAITAWAAYNKLVPPAFFWLPTFAILFLILAKIADLFPLKIKILLLSGLKWLDDHTLKIYTKDDSI